MAYDTITPITVNALSAAILTDSQLNPRDTEAANILGSVDRQTRKFLYDFLAATFSPTASPPTLLPAAVGSATLANIVEGVGTGGTTKAIKAGSIGTADLADGAVDTAKLKLLAVDTGQLQDDAVTTAKIEAGAVTATELASNAVETAKILDDAVTSAKIDDGTIIQGNLADNSIGTNQLIDANVTLAKLASAGGEGYILVAQTGGTWSAVPITGDISITKFGVVSLTSRKMLCFQEEFTTTTGGGASTADTYSIRGAQSGHSSWVVTYDSLTNYVITAPSGYITGLIAGDYLIECSAPGYDCGKHFLLIQQLDSGGTNVRASIHGSSEISADATGVQTRSVARGKFAMQSGDQIAIKHYFELDQAANGLGYPASKSGHNEVYAQVMLQRLS